MSGPVAVCAARPVEGGQAGFRARARASLRCRWG